MKTCDLFSQYVLPSVYCFSARTKTGKPSKKQRTADSQGKSSSHSSDLERITLLFYLTTLPLAHITQCRLSALVVKSDLEEIVEKIEDYFGVISEHSL